MTLRTVRAANCAVVFLAIVAAVMTGLYGTGWYVAMWRLIVLPVLFWSFALLQLKSRDVQVGAWWDFRFGWDIICLVSAFITIHLHTYTALMFLVATVIVQGILSGFAQKPLQEPTSLPRSS